MAIPIAEKYGWASADVEKSHQYLLPLTLQLLQKYQVQSMLDIGTGNGATLPIWLANGYQVAAMEPDAEGYGFAKQHSNVDVRQFGVGMVLPDDWQHHFDAVVSLEVVEHLFNPLDLVQTAKNALSSNGIAIVSTPYHGYWKNLMLAVFGKWDFHHHPERVGGHIKFWSKATLTDLFESQGFRKLSFHGAGRLPLLWKSMVLVFQKL